MGGCRWCEWGRCLPAGPHACPRWRCRAARSRGTWWAHGTARRQRQTPAGARTAAKRARQTHTAQPPHPVTEQRQKARPPRALTHSTQPCQVAATGDGDGGTPALGAADNAELCATPACAVPTRHKHKLAQSNGRDAAQCHARTATSRCRVTTTVVAWRKTGEGGGGGGGGGGRGPHTLAIAAVAAACAAACVAADEDFLLPCPPSATAPDSTQTTPDTPRARRTTQTVDTSPTPQGRPRTHAVQDPCMRSRSGRENDAAWEEMGQGGVRAGGGGRHHEKHQGVQRTGDG